MWWTLAVACRSPERLPQVDTGCSGLQGPCAGTPLSLVAGTGETEFVPFASGNEIAFHTGGQGAFHVFVGGEVAASSQEVTWQASVVVHNTFTQISGAGVTPIALTLNDWSACKGNFFGQIAPVQLAGANDQETNEYVCKDLPGETIDITLTVIDLATGESTYTTASATATIDETAHKCLCVPTEECPF